MRRLNFEPARPIDTEGMPWIPTGPGKSFRPLRFAADTQRALYLAWCREHAVNPVAQILG